MKIKRLICLILLCLLMFSCRKDEKHPIDFYYWKTDVSFGETEQRYFSALSCRRLFIRLFDVDMQGGEPVPLAKIKRFDPGGLPAEYVPAVFITNRTFLYVSDDQIADLVERIDKLIQEIATVNRLPEIREINIDCDWTPKTKEKYFHFLRILHEKTDKKISCTLRLHQIKDKAITGVPPVDKGYLMCYATSDPTGESTANSILDIPMLKAYTKTINAYPLTFDVSLPLYSWGIVTNHLGHKKLINGLTAFDLREPAFRQTAENRFEVMQDCFLHGLYINKGFTIKIEEITPELLAEAKRYLHQKIDRDYGVVYFHLSEGFLKRYSINDLN